MTRVGMKSSFIIFHTTLLSRAIVIHEWFPADFQRRVYEYFYSPSVMFRNIARKPLLTRFASRWTGNSFTHLVFNRIPNRTLQTSSSAVYISRGGRKENICHDPRRRRLEIRSSVNYVWIITIIYYIIYCRIL